MLKKTILIIESYSEISRTFALILQKNGYLTDLAQTTQEALEKLASNSYDAVIIDDEPAHIDSAKILENLNQQKTAKIVITDNPEKVSFNTADAYIQKIFNPQELLAITRKTLKT